MSEHLPGLHGARVVCACGDFNCASLDVETPRVPCSVVAPHGPHFWISAISQAVPPDPCRR